MTQEVSLNTMSLTEIETGICIIKSRMARDIIDIGNMLIEAKKKVPHGEWNCWLKDKVDFTQHTANKFMKVASEFGHSNCRLIYNLPSTKILALLDVQNEYREDFMGNLDIQNITVEQLKKEIQKYKEENGLLTERQRKALEEKRKIEEQARQLQQELQLEKSRPPKIETKVEYKERVVDKTDYGAIDKIKKLEEDNKRLAESKKRYEDAMNTYKKEVEQYHGLKDRMSRISCIDGGDVDELKALDDVNNLYLSINKFIKNELSPVRYDNCLRFVNGSEHVTRSFINMVSIVEEWCSDMREKLNENNNIITVEVK